MDERLTRLLALVEEHISPDDRIPMRGFFVPMAVCHEVTDLVRSLAQPTQETLESQRWLWPWCRDCFEAYAQRRQEDLDDIYALLSGPVGGATP